MKTKEKPNDDDTRKPLSNQLTREFLVPIISIRGGSFDSSRSQKAKCLWTHYDRLRRPRVIGSEWGRETLIQTRTLTKNPLIRVLIRADPLSLSIPSLFALSPFFILSHSLPSHNETAGTSKQDLERGERRGNSPSHNRCRLFHPFVRSFLLGNSWIWDLSCRPERKEGWKLNNPARIQWPPVVTKSFHFFAFSNSILSISKNIYV